MALKYQWVTNICFFMLLFCHSIITDFPQNPKRCSYEDSDCIVNVINYLMAHKYAGDESLNLPATDPFTFKDINLNRHSNIVNITCTLFANDLIGYQNIKVHRVKGFGKDMKKPHEIYFTFATASLVGKYEIDGTILSHPINGTGRSNMTMVNAEVGVILTGKPYKKNDGVHMKIDTLKIACEAEDYLFDFDNLYGGDKKRTSDMNTFMHEHWIEIFQDLHTIFFTAFEETFTTIINKVFEKYPYEQYFLESQY